MFVTDDVLPEEDEEVLRPPDPPDLLPCAPSKLKAKATKRQTQISFILKRVAIEAKNTEKKRKELDVS